MNWLKKKITRPQFELAEYGTLQLNRNRSGFEWFGRVTMPISDTPIELTIEVEGPNEPSGRQIQLIKDFANTWLDTKTRLFEYMTESFRDSKWEKDQTELQKMYYLSAIDLKKENLEWWIVLEPEFDVVSIFNFLPRFTVKNNEIVWSNLK